MSNLLGKLMKAKKKKRMETLPVQGALLLTA